MLKYSTKIVLSNSGSFRDLLLLPNLMESPVVKTYSSRSKPSPSQNNENIK